VSSLFHFLKTEFIFETSVKSIAWWVNWSLEVIAFSRRMYILGLSFVLGLFPFLLYNFEALSGIFSPTN
jgi:hypothetical protein